MSTDLDGNMIANFSGNASVSMPQGDIAGTDNSGNSGISYTGIAGAGESGRSAPPQTGGIHHSESQPSPQPASVQQVSSLQQTHGVQQTPNLQQGVPQGQGLLDVLRQQGVDPSRYGVTDDQTLIRMMAGLFTNWDRINEAIMLAEAVAPHLDKIRPVITGETAQQPSPANTTPPAGQPSQSPAEEYWRKPPEWRDEWLQYLAVDASGNVRAVNPLYEKYADAYRQRQQWERQAVERLLNDPIGLVLESPQFKQAVSQVIQAEIEQRRSRESLRQIIAANAEKFFQLDANGNPVVNPVTGEPVLTPAGKFAQDFLRWAAEADYESLLPIVIQIADLLQRTQQPAAQPSVQSQSQPPASAQLPDAQLPNAQLPNAQPTVHPGAERRHGQRGTGAHPGQQRVNSAVNFRDLLYRNAAEFGVNL